jgi:hypothetical protein
VRNLAKKYVHQMGESPNRFTMSPGSRRPSDMNPHAKGTNEGTHRYAHIKTHNQIIKCQAKIEIVWF